jgi:hypothetical protein
MAYPLAPEGKYQVMPVIIVSSAGVVATPTGNVTYTIAPASAYQATPIVVATTSGVVS